MRVIDLRAVETRPIQQFGSEGYSLGTLGVLRPGHVAYLTLEPGGVVGRHPAVGTQVLVVLSGSARVSGGAGGVPAQVEPGLAVMWEPGEDHETRTDEGLTALVLEGEWERGPLP